VERIADRHSGSVGKHVEFMRVAELPSDLAAFHLFGGSFSAGVQHSGVRIHRDDIPTALGQRERDVSRAAPKIEDRSSGLLPSDKVKEEIGMSGPKLSVLMLGTGEDDARLRVCHSALQSIWMDDRKGICIHHAKSCDGITGMASRPTKNSGRLGFFGALLTALYVISNIARRFPDLLLVEECTMLG
jgi:hypothetical protein